MPECNVLYYQEGDTVPVLDWLGTIPQKARSKCLTYLAELGVKGYELRRPVADLLRDGIYGLRPSYQGVQYRMLYFFSGKNVVVLSHGLTKEGKVSATEINRAIGRKKRFEANPKAHTFRPPIGITE